MKRVWWTIGSIACVVIICAVVFKIVTRPLITSDKVMATATQQLAVMGYTPPYNALVEGTFLGWNNNGRLFGAERVYFTTLSLQPKPGAEFVKIEVVEDARTGRILSAFQYNTPPGNPFY